MTTLKKSCIALIILFLLAPIFSSCRADDPIAVTHLPSIESTSVDVTETPKPVVQNTGPALSTSTPTRGLVFDDDVPEWVQEVISQHPEILKQVAEIDNTVSIGFEQTENHIGSIQYFLVAPFDVPLSSISLNQFNYIWSVDRIENNAWNGSFYLTEESQGILKHRWGNHNEGVISVALSEEGLISSLFENEQDKIAIIPAQYLSPKLRTIRIDNKSFFQPEESLARSVFSVPLYSTEELTQEPIPINFSEDQLSTVNITGVTALVRATAVLMRKNGNTYPGEKILDILTTADYTHISNEVSFSPFCPVQEYTNDSLLFCSPKETFELLSYIDADIIELTGDHLADYGPDAFLYTLELYANAGILTYGGGKNLAAAQEALRIEHNGNKFAFLGCNAKNPSYSRAAENYPGTWHCDLEVLKEEIKTLQSDGYTPIVTIQHLENELSTPPAALVEDFSELSTLTPVILIGSQAHITKPIILDEASFIHFGLGNLFFDQVNESEAHTEAVIDRLVFYDNQLLNVELFPIKFIDYAQSRPMTSEEEILFLSKIFSLSNFHLP